MIIAKSDVLMSSNRKFSSVSYSETKTKISQIGATDDQKYVIINSQTKVNNIKGSKKKNKSKEDLGLQLLLRILEAIDRNRKGRKSENDDTNTDLLADNKWYDDIGYTGISLQFMGIQVSNSSLVQRDDGQVGTLFRKETYIKKSSEETENTTFNATGSVVTSDGRQINFGISLEMSRSFCSKYEEYINEPYIFTDPLVINYDTDAASISDYKFFFDLNEDGEKEKISFVGKGSGFLALDKNNDGIINDGGELFGTKSGDGFKDLSAFDKDGNGFIDEADDIFDKLKIWIKNESGNDKLIDLKELGIGAIFLENVNTQYSLNDELNNTHAIIQKTGVFIKETGEVGTVQHLDMKI